MNDRDSRFGTLKKVEFPVKISKEVEVLQINNSILAIKFIKTLHQDEDKDKDKN